MPRGGYCRYQGTVGGTIYHNDLHHAGALCAADDAGVYRVRPTVHGRLDLRSYALPVLLTVATSFGTNLIFAFCPGAALLLIADFVRSRAKT